MPNCCQKDPWPDLQKSWAYDGVMYDDPVQGIAPNCSLIASLSSIAFVQPSFMVKNKIPIGTYKGTYPFTLYDYQNLQPKTYYVKPTLCLDNNNNFCYARSKTPYDEIWPAIWEKAYAAFRLNKPDKSIIDKVDYYLLDTNQKWGGNAFNALISLTGSSNHWPQPKTITNISVDEIFLDIDTICISCSTNSYKVVGPSKMVAWTYYQSFTGYTYNDRIAPNHNYSILGYYIDNAGNGYIVLRNPWGYCPPTIDPDNQAQNMVWCGYTLNGLNGTLAIPLEEFQTAFEAYGLVS